ncbi:hypothetical protein [Halarsenatibacter silvermanii]|uniref:Uncharacterized protein n=1 Tax=Halarsenatibacter silvermanii TaxID=321763 RepID=A0A1G9LV65_9FIRM|nr:hypothetical protein [Halarsenatibacter silvermanii]SDL65920.1 hypothetical protein SAMN04488692_10722 [Halarsenatibacter silvermanii]
MELYLNAGEPGEFPEILEEVSLKEHNSVTLKKDFLALKPNFNLHHRLRGSLAMDLSVGYLFTHDLGRGWEIGNESVKSDPISNLRGPELGLQLTYTF